MATKTAPRPATDDGYEQKFPDWVYLVPGVLLILVGLGGIMYLTFF